MNGEGLRELLAEARARIGHDWDHTGAADPKCLACRIAAALAADAPSDEVERELVLRATTYRQWPEGWCAALELGGQPHWEGSLVYDTREQALEHAEKVLAGRLATGVVARPVPAAPAEPVCPYIVTEGTTSHCALAERGAPAEPTEVDDGEVSVTPEGDGFRLYVQTTEDGDGVSHLLSPADAATLREALGAPAEPGATEERRCLSCGAPDRIIFRCGPCARAERPFTYNGIVRGGAGSRSPRPAPVSAAPTEER